MLKTVCDNVYFENADDKKLYPHIVFSYGKIDTGDKNRSDLYIDVDIFDKSMSAKRIEDLSDEVENLFNSVNVPQSTILPTFYLDGRKIVPDEDKSIRHRLITIIAQNYERK